MLVPQIVDWYVNGAAAEPTLAGIGATLVLAASGGSRVVDAIEGRVERRSGRAG